MSELVKHIEALNAETLAWVAEDPSNRWAGTLTTDLDHWNEYGVYTVEDLECYLLVNCISDMYKSLNGFRPRAWNFDEMSLEELQEVYNGLCAQSKREYEWEQEQEAQEEAEIAALCEEQGIDRATYDRWMADVDKYYYEYGDEEYYSYLRGEAEAPTVKLRKERDNAFHSTSPKWTKMQKRLGTKRQRENSKCLIKEAA